MTPLEQFLQKAEALLARVEAVLPAAHAREPDWKRGYAFRWRKRAKRWRQLSAAGRACVGHHAVRPAPRGYAKAADRAEHAPVRAGAA
ncbi:hypothetical protein LP420_11715 [Massilia sp. B-10]|nr:hypothetical protein LP420_11715 [Massilia sp. B-10]